MALLYHFLNLLQNNLVNVGRARLGIYKKKGGPGINKYRGWVFLDSSIFVYISNPFVIQKLQNNRPQNYSLDELLKYNV